MFVYFSYKPPKVKIYAPASQIKMAKFALNQSVKILNFYYNYTDNTLNPDLKEIGNYIIKKCRVS